MLRLPVSCLLSFLIVAGVASVSDAEVFDFQIIPGTDANQSSLTIEIEAVDVGMDSDSSTISGTAQLELDSPVAPFGQARLLDLTLILDEGLDFRMGPLNLIRASSQPGNLSTSMISPGPAAPVVDGVFSQVDNLFEVDGEIDVSLADEPFDLSTLDPINGDINDVEISLQGSQLQLGLDLDLLFETELEDVPVLGTVPLIISLAGSLTAVSNTAIPGDVDGNGIVEAGDINTLTNSILLGSTEPEFDLNGDGQVDTGDRTYWVEEIANTYFGDADLSGEFNSSDLITVFSAAEYEDGIPENSTWEDGDWSGDLEFDSSDFIVAFTHGGFETGPRPTQAVPEPTTTFYVGLLIVSIALRRQHS